jgi:hypothetical protein
MKIKLKTDMPVEKCIAIIENERAKDIKDAEKILKVIDGKSGELGMIQRKAAGAVLHKMLGLMGKVKLELVRDEFEVRAREGTMQFVAYEKGYLIINVPNEVIMGAKARGREEAGLKGLKKQFQASSVEYMEEFK